MDRATDGQPTSATKRLSDCGPCTPDRVRLAFDRCAPSRVGRQYDRGVKRGRRYWVGAASTTLATEAPSRSRGSIGDHLVGSATATERPLSDGVIGFPTPFRVQRSHRLRELSPTVPDLRGKYPQTIIKGLPNISIINHGAAGLVSPPTLRIRSRWTASQA